MEHGKMLKVKLMNKIAKVGTDVLSKDKYEIGEKIKITIERNGEEKTLVVKLGSKNKEA